MLLDVTAHAAQESDSKAAADLAATMLEIWPTLQYAHVDKGYVGDVTKLLKRHGIDVTVPDKVGTGFTVQAIRWRVERTIAWLKNFRRLCSDFERTVRSTQEFIRLASISLMLRRLCREPVVWKNRRKSD